jgi:hypothetical protein
MIDWDGYTLTVTLELWRRREACYKLANRVSLFLFKRVYWYDCGYCRRERGKLKCGAGPSSDELCIKERGRIFDEDEED